MCKHSKVADAMIKKISVCTISSLRITVYDGEFLNGKKHGNGKEYYFYHKLISEENYFYNRKKANSYINGKLEFLSKYSFNRECKLQFEGEYSNREKNGKGKVYYDNGKLQFEGYFLNGLSNESGKEYYDNGKLKFEGIFINGFIAKWKKYYKQPKFTQIYES